MPVAVPTLAGEPWLGVPPLYSIVGAMFAHLFAPWLPAHDAARLAGGFFVLLALLFAGFAGRELYGSEHGRLAALVLVGSVGLWVRAHESIPQTALLAGVAMVGYGAALSVRRAYLGGAIVGTGLGISFMSVGVVETFALAVALLALPVFSPHWRQWRTLQAALMTLLATAPWLLIWPWALWQAAPSLLIDWWHSQVQARLVFWGAPGVTWTAYYFKFLPWFAWPAWPLALWTLWHSRREQLTSTGVVLPVAMWLSMTLVLSFTVDPSPDNGLPILIPLAWLAAGSAFTLRRGAANALYWFAMMSFGVVAIAAWVYWSAFDLGVPAQLSAHLRKLQPSYVGDVHPFPVAMAMLYCVAWIVLLVRMQRSPQRPLIAWAAGMALTWGLAASLFERPMDERMGYDGVMKSMQSHLPSRGCVASEGVNAGARAMLDYYLGVQTLRVENTVAPTCAVLLVEIDNDMDVIPTRAGWRAVWHGHRSGNRVEHFILYRKIKHK
jgi:4-amino-4-deoxy-L-arabinose transferase-like glycosyltransferase